MSAQTVSPDAESRLDLGPESGGVDRFVTPDMAERAEAEANRWIKQLRHAEVDGVPFRERFNVRGDSLWWFAELYLHKRRIVTRVFRAVYALEALAAGRRHARWDARTADRVGGRIAAAVAARHGIPCDGPGPRVDGNNRISQSLKALFHTSTALADRLRPGSAATASSSGGVVAFVHSAFARGNAVDESYVGPVLGEIERRLGPDALRLVGLGPRTNFRIRRWRDRLREFSDPAARDLRLTPVDSFAGWRDLGASNAQWRRRSEAKRALASSEAIRDLAHVAGYDVWPILAPEFDGIAALQFPWSVRAMDEAGAALDRLAPDVAVTYAEAGGWGRALVLEARRRKIPVVALQHGFIYRHWLNYQHEPDEMRPSTHDPSDRGFPIPDRTLLFDDLAREHLEREGRFPSSHLAVTGSPRLDGLVASARSVDGDARAALRQACGAARDSQIVLVAAKHSQIASAFPALVAAVRELPDVVLVVRPHPAEGPVPYQQDAAGVANVRIAPPADLGALLAVASVLVTVNSTAALEAMPLDVPALVLALPNNLSPFVEAGVMAGAGSTAAIGPALRGLLYDRKMRGELAAARREFTARYRIRADGGAASRAADLIVGFIGR